MLGDDAGRMHAAFSLEGAAVEATYIVGPVVIAGAIGAHSTFAALLVCVGADRRRDGRVLRARRFARVAAGRHGGRRARGAACARRAW